MNITITDIIKQSFDGRYQQRDPLGTEGIMLHRCGVNLVDQQILGYDAPSVIDAFLGRRPEWLSVAAATNRQNAYTFLIGADCGPLEYDGKVWQALPLDEIGWHGLSYSKQMIGISWIADPRRRVLSKKAWDAAVELCIILCAWRDWDPYRAIKGHGEVAGATGFERKAPGQPDACPGLSLRELNLFRDDVAVRSRLVTEIPSITTVGIVLAV